MSRLLSPALAGAIKYEFRMAARRKVVWLAGLPLLAIAPCHPKTPPVKPDLSSHKKSLHDNIVSLQDTRRGAHASCPWGMNR